MPRKQKDPIIDVMNYFETVSIDAAKLALVVVGGIVQRRSAQRAEGERIVKRVRERVAAEQAPPTPLRSRAEEVVTEEPNPLDPKPKARVRRPKPIQEQVTPLLPGPMATVGE